MIVAHFMIPKLIAVLAVQLRGSEQGFLYFGPCSAWHHQTIKQISNLGKFTLLSYANFSMCFLK